MNHSRLILAAMSVTFSLPSYAERIMDGQVWGGNSSLVELAQLGVFGLNFTSAAHQDGDIGSRANKVKAIVEW